MYVTLFYSFEYMNLLCFYRVSEEFQVALKFQSFEIENHDNCVYDYLGIVNKYYTLR